MARSANSDTHGRAFEHETVRLLLERGVLPHKHTLEYQLRDGAKLAACQPDIRSRIEQVSPRVVKWIAQQTSRLPGLLVERLGDSTTEVADIRILRGNAEVLSVSMKFNHEALRHPRPYSLALACGFTKGSAEDLQHRAGMSGAIQPLVSDAKKSGFTEFRQLSNATRSRMYASAVNTCARSIKEWSSKRSEEVPRKLFRFIVCPGLGFYKVIAGKKDSDPVMVQDFRKIDMPTTVAVSCMDQYLSLKFDNGWEIRMRLHSASSDICTNGGQISLKFDALRKAGAVVCANLP